MGKKVLLIRWGAFGDHVHMSNVIRAFDEDGWEVSMEYNIKGAQIHSPNPRIKKHIEFDPWTPENQDTFVNDPQKRKRHMEEVSKGYDLVVSFQNSIETELIESDESHKYWWPLKMRREKNANICYYDQSMIRAGLTDKRYMGQTGEVFFHNHEHAMMGKFMERFEGKKVVLWALRGSMYQKAMYPWAEEVVTRFCEKHPDAVFVTTGDPTCKQLEWDHPQVMHKSGVWPFRQALLMSRYANMVVTPETGLGIGAGSYATPKIMFLTAASLKNVVGNDSNDFSMQSDAFCSPCTRAIYDTNNCPHLDGMFDFDGMPLPICIAYDTDKVLARMEEAMDCSMRIGRKVFDPSDKREVYV